MSIKKAASEKAFDVFNHLLMVPIIFITTYPFFYVIFASLSDPEKLVQNFGLLLKPMGFTLSSYGIVFKNPWIVTGYKNTIIYVVLGTAINILLTSLGAYVLSRKNLYWKKALIFFVIFTMFFDGGMIPTYLLIRSLNMIDKLWVMIIPGAIYTWNLIVMRTSFMGIPDSMEESAKIDGANDFVILFRIIIPLSLPLVAVMILFYSVSHWNEWFSAMIYLKSRDKYPLQLFLREIVVQQRMDSMLSSIAGNYRNKEKIGAAVRYASIVSATLPILIVYPFLQKYFVKGVMIGALKG